MSSRSSLMFLSVNGTARSYGTADPHTRSPTGQARLRPTYRFRQSSDPLTIFAGGRVLLPPCCHPSGRGPTAAPPGHPEEDPGRGPRLVLHAVTMGGSHENETFLSHPMASRWRVRTRARSP